ncbi:class I SAM-dependent methyltransferase [Sodalis ligni]|uniref:Methyltransferase family protein n=1 Tax=Sodalis ligni TaxID=2697027 RepID=A0A4R1N4J9_9GAMM|nr:class I SAM-dependent methyltransferase [Sodalis ligni]TCL02085.1 hypothetical protein EZJ58_0077 [Sodalis ligni]
MSNPWEKLDLAYYEGHMQFESVRQAQILNEIMQSQFNDYTVSSICILGIAGGNGLEHINKNTISKVYGIDVNEQYLHACQNRFTTLDSILELRHADLTLSDAYVPEVEIIVANLVIEYIGLNIFTKLLAENPPKYVSCVIQINCENAFVSSTPFEEHFEEISSFHNDINEKQLIKTLQLIGFRNNFVKAHSLPNKKNFLRLDFVRG